MATVVTEQVLRASAAAAEVALARRGDPLEHARLAQVASGGRVQTITPTATSLEVIQIRRMPPSSFLQNLKDI